MVTILLFSWHLKINQVFFSNTQPLTDGYAKKKNNTTILLKEATSIQSIVKDYMRSGLVYFLLLLILNKHKFKSPSQEINCILIYMNSTLCQSL